MRASYNELLLGSTRRKVGGGIKLTQERIQKLEGIGFQWRMRARRIHAGNASSVRNCHARNVTNVTNAGDPTFARGTKRKRDQEAKIKIETATNTQAKAQTNTNVNIENIKHNPKHKLSKEQEEAQVREVLATAKALKSLKALAQAKTPTTPTTPTPFQPPQVQANVKTHGEGNSEVKVQVKVHAEADADVIAKEPRIDRTALSRTSRTKVQATVKAQASAQAQANQSTTPFQPPNPECRDPTNSMNPTNPTTPTTTTTATTTPAMDVDEMTKRIVQLQTVQTNTQPNAEANTLIHIIHTGVQTNANEQDTSQYPANANPAAQTITTTQFQPPNPESVRNQTTHIDTATPIQRITTPIAHVIGVDNTNFKTKANIDTIDVKATVNVKAQAQETKANTILNAPPQAQSSTRSKDPETPQVDANATTNATTTENTTASAPTQWNSPFHPLLAYGNQMMPTTQMMLHNHNVCNVQPHVPAQTPWNQAYPMMPMAPMNTTLTPLMAPLIQHNVQSISHPQAQNFQMIPCFMTNIPMTSMTSMAPMAPMTVPSMTSMAPILPNTVQVEERGRTSMP